MAGIKDAFNALLGMTAKQVTIKRLSDSGDDFSGTIRAAYSNFFRNQEGPANSTFEGREFVISKKSVIEAGLTSILKNDRLVFPDEEVQEVTIDSVREMTDIGGEIIGYRVTTR